MSKMFWCSTAWKNKALSKCYAENKQFCRTCLVVVRNALKTQKNTSYMFRERFLGRFILLFQFSFFVVGKFAFAFESVLENKNCCVSRHDYARSFVNLNGHAE